MKQNFDEELSILQEKERLTLIALARQLQSSEEEVSEKITSQQKTVACTRTLEPVSEEKLQKKVWK